MGGGEATKALQCGEHRVRMGCWEVTRLGLLLLLLLAAQQLAAVLPLLLSSGRVRVDEVMRGVLHRAAPSRDLTES